MSRPETTRGSHLGGHVVHRRDAGPTGSDTDRPQEFNVTCCGYAESAFCSLVDGAVFEERGGETVLAARGPIAKLAFERRINPHIAYSVGSTGWVDLGASLKRLAANGWFDVRELRGGIEIRLGTAARKLLERDQEGSKTASG